MFVYFSCAEDELQILHGSWSEVLEKLHAVISMQEILEKIQEWSNYAKDGDMFAVNGVGVVKVRKAVSWTIETIQRIKEGQL